MMRSSLSFPPTDVATGCEVLVTRTVIRAGYPDHWARHHTKLGRARGEQSWGPSWSW